MMIASEAERKFPLICSELFFFSCVSSKAAFFYSLGSNQLMSAVVRKKEKKEKKERRKEREKRKKEGKRERKRKKERKRKVIF